MTAIVVTENIRKVFDKEMIALQDVSFAVEQGELFGLFGSNGAGKSTLIRILATLLNPTSGTAFINGHDVVQYGSLARASLGLVTADERSFYGRLTARQNLTFYAAMQSIPRREIGGRVEGVLDLFGLAHKAESSFQSLSTGQRQRLNMARALIHNPPLLFLDEPTKSMDVQTSDFVKELIRNELVNNQGKTVIFISHELYEMDNFCDRVVILADGAVQAIGSPSDLRKELPQNAVYRVIVKGDPDLVQSEWKKMPAILQITEISRGASLNTFHLELAHETNELWVSILRAAGHANATIESYQRVDDGSLRHIIKHFTKGAGFTTHG
jgi:ABC-2 type transport system ATP-binding protein